MVPQANYKKQMQNIQPFSQICDLEPGYRPLFSNPLLALICFKSLCFLVFLLMHWTAYRWTLDVTEKE